MGKFGINDKTNSTGSFSKAGINLYHTKYTSSKTTSKIEQFNKSDYSLKKSSIQKKIKLLD